MFVQINKEEFAKESNKKAWYQTNNIIWTIIFLYPLLSIVDFIYAGDIWIQFLIARIIIVLIIMGLYSVFQTRKFDYRILLHIAFILLSIPAAILCTIVNIQELTVYFLIYSAIILFFNLQVYWEPVNSVVQVVFAIVLLTLFFNISSQYTLDLFISNGGQYFFITSVISCLIVSSRYKVAERDVKSQILIEKSNQQLKEQNKDIIEKNNIIDMQYDKLRKLDEQKNSFINIAGHDLKNLIGSVIMSTGMIKEEEYRLSTDQKEFLQYISDSADKMQYMLNKLMDVKEIESPEIKFNFEIFDINAEVRYVYKGLIETAQMKNITLVDNILKLPLNVRLDKVFAGQVFQNLMSNAIKFSQTNNSIKIATSLQRQKFVFEIIDEGIAIGQEELDGMFGKLRTLNDATSENATGSRLGLGLSIAKLMTQEMGGELSYRSDYNGNYFRVEFNVIN
ncbi:sensor histidine kinase [Mucilaginibacter sp. KACC 22063]|uniref:sensor histidine kinase n=1 Tax=Mucilaginibacter sp. KACC 22063 TaxID=3025666 RepID=UPI00236607C3|nr:HAMP domain-containing sensor histidine kinase [Mucilaginibacter sp. KACC 22063]WDF56345.1 HAMP domain-containing sensor histidine kinase [Mucilaginibacter sp. KACC 22063]